MRILEVCIYGCLLAWTWKLALWRDVSVLFLMDSQIVTNSIIFNLQTNFLCQV